MSMLIRSLTFSSVLCSCATTGASNSSTDIIDAQYEAYNSRDIDAFMTFYARDAKICSFPSNVCFDGENQIRAHFTKLFSGMSSLKASVSKRILDHDYILDWEEVNAEYDTGKILKLSGISVYQIKEGKIKNLTIFMRDQK